MGKGLGKLLIIQPVKFHSLDRVNHPKTSPDIGNELDLIMLVGSFQLRLFNESLTLKKEGYLCAPSMAKEPLVWEAVSGSAPHQLALPSQPEQHSPAECPNGPTHHIPLTLLNSTASSGAMGSMGRGFRNDCSGQPRDAGLGQGCVGHRVSWEKSRALCVCSGAA